MQNDRDAAKVDIEKGALQPTAVPIAASEPHSIYTKNQKRMMVVAAAVASTFSPITGNIYLPALNSVAHDLKVSNSVVTLTVSFYMVSTLGMFLVSLQIFVRSRRIKYTSAGVCTVYPTTQQILFTIRCTKISINKSYPSLLQRQHHWNLGSEGRR
jgi:hypothetical protein